MCCDNATIDQHLDINILEAFGDDAFSLDKPANNSNQQFLHMNLTVVSTTELTNDL